MVYWLAEAAVGVRSEAGKSIHDIKEATGIPKSTLYRFEAGHTWSREVEDIIAGYAQIGHLHDARELWALAITLWFEHGEAPNGGDDISDRISQLVRKQLRRQNNKSPK